ncbi:MAG: hypothetical protein QXO70_02695 [Candidatus Pacearchaeota archaeon]
MAREIAKKDQGTTDIVDISMFSGAGSGFEGTTSETFKTPFLKILQALSPELKKSDPKYIPGAEQGKFCNSATQELYDELEVVVLKVEHSLVVWKPNRGGFVGRYPKTSEESIVAKREGVQKWDADGNEVVDTIEFFCMSINNPSDIFIIPMSTASFKHGRSWATRLRMLKANGKPVNVSWAGVWKISTVEEKNELGSWYTIGATPEFVRFITKEEKENFVIPAKEMLRHAETDYAAMDNDKGGNEEVTF